MSAAPGPAITRRVAERASATLDALGHSRTGRRGFLVKAALVGSALVSAPLAYLLRPGTAYSAVCGSAASCSAGYTAFCCTLNRGMNKCPPGTFVGGWWKADRSAYCCAGGSPGPRYYIDCHGRCAKCTSGCGRGSPFCTSGCVNCSCRCSGSSTCDQRKVCCNYFRYGQCHQEVPCSGPVACRVVSCTPPHRLYASCGSTLLRDNATASHSAPCLDAGCA